MARFILTDDNGHLVTLSRTATTASFFDHCLALIRSRLVDRADPDGILDVEHSVQLSYAEIGLIRALGHLPWISEQVLSGIPRARLAWIVYEPLED